MNNTDRALRLQLDARQAISDNIKSLRTQKRNANTKKDKTRIQELINDLRDEYDDLLDLSIQIVEGSEELKLTIIRLRTITNEIDEEAGKIKSVADALEKGAKIIDKATKVVGGLIKLMPS